MNLTTRSADTNLSRNNCVISLSVQTTRMPHYPLLILCRARSLRSCFSTPALGNLAIASCQTTAGPRESSRQASLASQYSLASKVGRGPI